MCLLAFWDSSDQWHDRVIAALDQTGDDAQTLTTSYVLLECGSASDFAVAATLEVRTASK